VPVLPRAGRPRRPPAGQRRDPLRLRSLSRPRDRPVGAVAVGELSDLDAVTIDAYGTLVTLIDPVPGLRTALAERGVERSDEQVRAAFRAEVEYYTPRSHVGPLEELRHACVAIFLEAAGAELDVE